MIRVAEGDLKWLDTTSFIHSSCLIWKELALRSENRIEWNGLTKVLRCSVLQKEIKTGSKHFFMDSPSLFFERFKLWVEKLVQKGKVWPRSWDFLSCKRLKLAQINFCEFTLVVFERVHFEKERMGQKETWIGSKKLLSWINLFYFGNSNLQGEKMG